MSENGISADLHDQLLQFFRGRTYSAEPLVGGTNNQLYKISLESGETYVLKKYYQDDRQRLQREYDFLLVLQEKGFTDVPTPIARFDALNAALYSYMSGQRVDAENLSRSQLDAIADHLTRLQSIEPHTVTRPLLDGFSVAFSLGEFIECIEKSIDRFEAGAVPQLDPRVHTFLEETNILSRVSQALNVLKKELNVETRKPISDEYKRLSPIDLGVHNMLWTDDGALAC